jgi:hypothetical protein
MVILNRTMLYSALMAELVDHIRTVHFTVLIVAFTIMIALGVDNQRALGRAAGDAESILHMVEDWDDTVSAIDKEVKANASKAKPISQGIDSSAVVLPEAALYQTRFLRGKLGDAYPKVFNVKTAWVFVVLNKDGSGEAKPISRWATLNDFLEFWDGQVDGKSVFLPVILQPSEGISHCHDIRVRGALSDQNGVGTITYSINENQDGRYQMDPIVTGPPFAPGLPPQQACDFRTLETFPIETDLGHAFHRAGLSDRRWGNRKSGEEFPELISASKQLRNSPLADLSSALRDRINADPGRIELLQAQMPASAIPTYGSVILVVCQLYLLAHLFELQRLTEHSNPSREPTGYIGLYFGAIPRILTILSLAGLPPYALSAALRGSPNPIFISGLFAISLIVGVASVLILDSIKKVIAIGVPP